MLENYFNKKMKKETKIEILEIPLFHLMLSTTYLPGISFK